jgi:hypothetical protein
MAMPEEKINNGGIKTLPTVILQLIQLYINVKDYLSLMNTSLSIFRAVKLETVRYLLIVSSAELARADVKERLQKMVNSVNDKSKQISMTLLNLSQSSTRKIGSVYHGIGNLSLHTLCGPMENDFSFGMFHSILHLSLVNVQGVPEANLYLQKTIKLEVKKCGFKAIFDWNSNVLQEVTLSDCASLTILPSFGNIPVISISACKLINYLPVGNQRKLFFSGTSLSSESLEFMHLMFSTHSSSSFLNSIQELTLRCEFPQNFRDFSFCVNVPILELLHIMRRSQFYFPHFSNFLGNKLSLSNFNLSSWASLSLFPNLEYCTLNCCLGLTHNFPEMPKLTNLLLSYCQDLVALSSFPVLTHLFIQCCYNLSFIGSSPNVMEVSIENAGKLENVFGLGNVKTMKIQNCVQLKKIPSLRNLMKLEIRNCEQLSDLQEMTMDWSHDFLVEKRVVQLFRLPSLQNFSFCRNTFSLELTEMPQMRNCEGIGNIHDLILIGCNKLNSTGGLGTVTGSLLIRKCSSLKTLLAVENIPEVVLQSCPKAVDLTGLRDHIEMVIGDSRLFMN